MILTSAVSALTPYKIYFAIAAVIAVLGAEFFIVRDYYVTKHENAIYELQREADRKYQEANNLKNTTEDELTKTKDTLEKKNVESKQKIDDLHAYYAKRIRDLGLRDPGRIKKPAGPVPNNSGDASQCSESGQDGKLSEQANEFLLSYGRDAEKVREDLKTCLGMYDAAKKKLEEHNQKLKKID